VGTREHRDGVPYVKRGILPLQPRSASIEPLSSTAHDALAVVALLRLASSAGSLPNFRNLSDVLTHIARHGDSDVVGDDPVASSRLPSSLGGGTRSGH
jgi:hypothetical protein